MQERKAKNSHFPCDVGFVNFELMFGIVGVAYLAAVLIPWLMGDKPLLASWLQASLIFGAFLLLILIFPIIKWLQRQFTGKER